MKDYQNHMVQTNNKVTNMRWSSLMNKNVRIWPIVSHTFFFKLASCDQFLNYYAHLLTLSSYTFDESEQIDQPWAMSRNIIQLLLCHMHAQLSELPLKNHLQLVSQVNPAMSSWLGCRLGYAGQKQATSVIFEWQLSISAAKSAKTWR